MEHLLIDNNFLLIVSSFYSSFSLIKDAMPVSFRSE